MTDHQTTMFVINILLFGGFCVTAYDTFKGFKPLSAMSMCLALYLLYYING